MVVEPHQDRRREGGHEWVGDGRTEEVPFETFHFKGET